MLAGIELTKPASHFTSLASHNCDTGSYNTSHVTEFEQSMKYFSRMPHKNSENVNLIIFTE